MKRLSKLSWLLVLLGLFAAPSALAGDEVTITEVAREHFRAGVAYLEDPSGPKYEEAYREFHAAYAESPTYKILTNIGLCALNMERDGEAIDAYQRFLAKATAADIPPAKRKQMERDIAMLKASLVHLKLTGAPATITLDDERTTNKGTIVVNRYELQNGQIELGLHPGHHRITAKAEGFLPQSWDFEADSATAHSHDFKLSIATPQEKQIVAPQQHEVQVRKDVTAPPTHRGQRTHTAAYVGAAVTGVFALGATVTGVLEIRKRHDFDSTNKAGNDPKEARSLKSSAQRLALLTDIGFGAAILAAGATAILYFTGTSKEPEPQANFARLQLQPTLSPTQAGLAMSAQF